MKRRVHLLERIVRRAKSEYDQCLAAHRLAPLYSPEVSNLDLDAHLTAAVDWLKRAQDAGEDRGVSYGVRFGSDFEPSYPETTGYICQTFVEMSRKNGDPELIARAMEMGQWEADVQLPDGAVMGGMFNQNPTPAVFNTGMVLLGWSALLRTTNDARIATATCRAGDWLVRMQESDGNWIRGISQHAEPNAATYHVKAAWGLCEAGLALGRRDYVDAAVRNAEFCLTCQQPNGWFRDSSLDAPKLLHGLAYEIQGLLEIGKLTQRQEFIAAAQRTADAEMAILDKDGFLPAYQNANFHGTVSWCCVTGSAQMSTVWSSLYAMTGQDKYRDAACRVNKYLMARHDIRNPDPRLRGGVTGSWPVNGRYMPLKVLNWAAKFFVDALASEKYQLWRGVTNQR
jgi:hypothetical protein